MYRKQAIGGIFVFSIGKGVKITKNVDLGTMAETRIQSLSSQHGIVIAKNRGIQAGNSCS
jgi:hypothetical protein